MACDTAQTRKTAGPPKEAGRCVNRKRRASYQLTRQTSCAVRAALCVDRIWNRFEPLVSTRPLFAVVAVDDCSGKFSALVAWKTSTLNSTRAPPGSWEWLASRKSLCLKQGVRK